MGDVSPFVSASGPVRIDLSGGSEMDDIQLVIQGDQLEAHGDLCITPNETQQVLRPSDEGAQLEVAQLEAQGDFCITPDETQQVLQPSDEGAQLEMAQLEAQGDFCITPNETQQVHAEQTGPAQLDEESGPLTGLPPPEPQLLAGEPGPLMVLPELRSTSDGRGPVSFRIKAHQGSVRL